jgi:hypothetical protein
MFGVSYFAIAAQRVVSLKPPHLKAIFAPFAATDRYRDTVYHGGILAHGFMNAVKNIWSTPKLDAESWRRKKYGEERFRQAIAEALVDNELRAVPYIFEALRSGKGALEAYLLNVDGEYYREQSVDYSSTGEWRHASEWPLPETRWTPFYLHADGLLSEHEFWPDEGASTFEDSPYNRGSLTIRTFGGNRLPRARYMSSI